VRIACPILIAFPNVRFCFGARNCEDTELIPALVRGVALSSVQGLAELQVRQHAIVYKYCDVYYNAYVCVCFGFLPRVPY
jgi:hypothetical protein